MYCLILLCNLPCFGNKEKRILVSNLGITKLTESYVQSTSKVHYHSTNLSNIYWKDPFGPSEPNKCVCCFYQKDYCITNSSLWFHPSWTVDTKFWLLSCWIATQLVFPDQFLIWWLQPTSSTWCCGLRRNELLLLTVQTPEPIVFKGNFFFVFKEKKRSEPIVFISKCCCAYVQS